MDAFKRVITILGVAIAVLGISITLVALWAINRKEQNNAKTAAATAGRWKEKPKPTNDVKEETTVAGDPQMDPSANSGGDSGPAPGQVV